MLAALQLAICSGVILQVLPPATAIKPKHQHRRVYGWQLYGTLWYSCPEIFLFRMPVSILQEVAASCHQNKVALTRAHMGHMGRTPALTTLFKINVTVTGLANCWMHR